VAGQRIAVHRLRQIAELAGLVAAVGAPELERRVGREDAEPEEDAEQIGQRLTVAPGRVDPGLAEQTLVTELVRDGCDKGPLAQTDAKTARTSSSDPL
jgi:hypothetical protein